jgi:hypothetical protein
VRRKIDSLEDFRLHPCDTRDNETIGATILSTTAEKMVRRDASALMRVSTGEGGRRQKPFTKEPAAIPQQLQPMRSLANTYSAHLHPHANVWLTLEPKGREIRKYSSHGL